MTKDEQTRFMMIVGLPASGKSTIASELLEGRDDIVYLSSDLLRIEMFGDVDHQDSQSKVFEEMLKRTKEALKEDKHVIYDATNINRKKRRGLLHQLPKGIKKVAVYASTEYKTILEQNNNRDRVVPKHVIDKMYKNMHIPIYSEGWDMIVFLHHNEITDKQFPKQFTDAVRAGALFGREGYELIKFLATYFEEFFPIYELAQDSTYHSFSVSRHIYHVYKYTLENYETDDEREKEVMLWTALLHDIGKAFTKSFINRKGEETKYASFIGHENVGSQLAVTLLHKMNFSEEFIYEVATLIQFHMYLLDKSASRKKLKDYVGDKMFDQLDFLREADTQAH